MKIGFFNVALSLVFFLLTSLSAAADEKNDLKVVMQKKIDNITHLLKNSEDDKEKRNKKIIETIESIFNFKLMAKLSLGSKQWRALSKEEKKEFSDLFIKRLQNSYLEKLDLYTDEKILVEDAKQIKKNRIYITTYLIDKDGKKEILYKFYRAKDNGWWIYDVDVLGVSVIQTYRSQFAEVLKKESVKQLLERMRSSDI